MELLFQDNRALVVNKPAGLPVYPGRAGGASVEDHFPAWRRGNTGPWLAHRLDQDTAGCLLVARGKQFLLAAQAALAAGEALKLYWGILSSVPAQDAGEIDAPLLKETQDRRWRMVVSPEGEAARTGWRVLGTHAGRALVEFTLHTGRTHQIRAHAAHLGHAVSGDPVYGDAQGMMCLLALRLLLPGLGVEAIAPPPPHMADFVEACLGPL